MEHPSWLFLLLLCIPFIWFRKPRYYVKISSIIYSGVKRFPKNYSRICEYIACFVLLCAAVDFFYTGNFRTYTSPKCSFVLIDDASASMQISSPQQAHMLIKQLVKSNVSFLETLQQRNKQDLVGCVAFSNDAFVISYMIDDLEFVKEKLLNVDWAQQPLNQGTAVEKALWAGIKVVFKNSDSKVSEKTVSDIKELTYGIGDKFDTRNLNDKFEELRKVSAGSCLILFTDGYFDITAPVSSMQSTTKIVDLCKYLGIKVYILDLLPLSNVFNSSGFTKTVESTGGKIFFISDNKIDDAYQKIFEIEAAPRNVYIWQRKSFSPYFGLMALSCLLVSFFTKKIITSI